MTIDHLHSPRTEAASSAHSVGDGASSRPAAGVVDRLGPYASLLLGLSAILLIWLGAFYFIRKESQQTTTAALQNSANLARAFEEQLIRALRAADQTLLYVRDSYARDPRGFDISLWSRNSQFLSDFSFQLAIIDREGIMVASNIGPSNNRVDLSDREHFRVHASRDTDELFISKPILGRVSGKWSIQVTRRITMPDGSFGGVVVVSLDPEYLASFYRSIDIGEKGSVAVVGLDGVVRARVAPGASTVGESLAGTQLFKSVAAAPAGNYLVRSQLDNIERIFAYRVVRNYPLVVTVGLASDEVYGLFNKDFFDLLLIAILLTIWLLVITGLMSRHEKYVARARIEAEAGARAQSEFLAMMSHEIRTPMNGVVGMADLLLDSGLSLDQSRLAGTLKESAEHLLQIINDVLDFSKIEADRMEIDQVSFGVAHVARGAMEILAGRAREKKIDLKLDIAPDVPARVIGDPARLRQVLLNLIGNGVKFTQVGEVRVTIENLAEASIGHVRLAFTIRDTGIGIPADDRKFLFREFSQLDRSISRRFGGTGLGLAISRRLVKLMGGDISVDSELGKGSSFRFTADFISHSREFEPTEDEHDIQILSANESQNKVIDLAMAFKQRGARVLLVEDNPTNQLVATKLLKSLGLTATVVGDGVEAVALCAQEFQHLVLMDIMMPEMDGVAATKAIRKLPRPNNECYIVALTANALDGDEKACRAAGMDDFLAKPFTRVGLRAAIEKFLAATPDRAPLVISQRSVENDLSRERPFDESAFGFLADQIGREDALMVLNTFLNDTSARIERMEEAAARSDNGFIRREAHAIKSSAASVGLAEVSRIARSIEGEAASMTSSRLQSETRILAGAFAHASETIRTLYQLDREQTLAA